jgi:hypothetical protein
MERSQTRITPGVMAMGAMALVAIPALVGSWVALAAQPPTVEDPVTIVLALCLMAALVGCYRFPIHIRVSSKIYMGSVVMFLMATTLPPGLATTVAGLGMFLGELTAQHRTGNPLYVIVGQASRTVILVLVASIVAHLPLANAEYAPLLLVAAGVVLWVGDVLTFPFLYCPITGENPARVIRVMVLGAGLPEAAQYLVGVLGALELNRGVWTLALLFLPTLLVYHAFKNTKEMHDETRRILESMADTVDLRDPYTGGHSRRVAQLAARTLRQLDKHGPEVQLIVSAARVHDIGKIGIPDGILMKTGPLTDEEWAIMQEHPERGAELLARYPDFARGVEIIRHHHEAWDGSGYPHRIKDRDIPFGSRVIAVCDSYDAITSDRPYRKGKSPERAAAILREGRGRQWDPQVVDAFICAIADLLPEHDAPRLHLVQPEPAASVAV